MGLGGIEFSGWRILASGFNPLERGMGLGGKQNGFTTVQEGVFQSA
jgi:hypothetical protein